MLRRIFSTFPSSLVLALAFLSARPATAQLERTFTIPAANFTVDRGSHATLAPVPGAVRIRPTTRDSLFVIAKVPLPAGRFEVTHVVVRFRTDKQHNNAALSSLELRDPQSGVLINAQTRASGNFASLVLFTPAGAANAWKPFVRVPPQTIGTGAIVRVGIASGLPIDGPGQGEPFDLISVDVFVKTPFVLTLPPSTSVKPSPSIGDRVTSPAPAAPAPAAAPVVNIPHSKAVIYVINDAHELLWYRHDGRSDGSFQWASNVGSRVGIGWDFRTVIGGGDGVMYAINTAGDLIWYRHDGAGDGSFQWAQAEGRTVNSGFSGMQVFAAGHGVLYARNRNGDLLWFRHDGYADGTDRWTAREGRVIGSNWPRVRLFAGDAGTLYAATAHELYRFKYDGRMDGSGTLSFDQGQQISSTFDYFSPFSSGDGIIYAVNAEHQLLWFHDEGYNDGTIKWENTDPKVVGVGWQFHTIFSGASLRP